MSKIFTKVKLEKIHSYEAPKYGYSHGSEIHYIYVMKGEDGKTYVWKTAQVMRIFNNNDCICRPGDNDCYEGDELFIVGTFRGESEFRGQLQTLINRVEVKERFFAGLTPEEKLKKQLASVGPEDKILRVFYGEYKKNYSDCETVMFSYDASDKTIEIIVRNFDKRK